MLIMMIMIIDDDHDYHQKHSRFCDRNGEDDQGDKSQFTDPPQHFNKTLKLHRTIYSYVSCEDPDAEDNFGFVELTSKYSTLENLE